MGEQHDLSVRKLERIVVGALIVHVDLPEPGDLVGNGSLAPPRKDQLEPGQLALDLVFESDLGARKQAHRNGRLADRGKSAGGGIPELGRDQSIADFRGTWSSE